MNRKVYILFISMLFVLNSASAITQEVNKNPTSPVNLGATNSYSPCFVNNYTGTVDSIAFNITQYGANAKVKYGLYSHSGGQPSILLSSTTLTDLVLASNVSMVNTTTYCVAVYSDTTGTYINSVPGSVSYASSAIPSTWTQAGTTAANGNFRYNISTTVPVINLTKTNFSTINYACTIINNQFVGTCTFVYGSDLSYWLQTISTVCLLFIVCYIIYKEVVK